MKISHPLGILVAEVGVVVVISAAVAAAYWLKGMYDPGPTHSIIAIGTGVSAVLGWLIFGQRGHWRKTAPTWVACLAAATMAGVMTFLLSIGFTTSLVG